MGKLAAEARVIIVGGGGMGRSVTDHLDQRGCGDVLLLERHRLTAGATWHAAGLGGFVAWVASLPGWFR